MKVGRPTPKISNCIYISTKIALQTPINDFPKKLHIQNLGSEGDLLLPKLLSFYLTPQVISTAYRREQRHYVDFP